MPTATYIALANTTLGSATSTVTFSSIPATYRDLVLVVNAKATTSLENTYITINSDTNGGNYPYVVMGGTGSTTYSASYTERTWGQAATTDAMMIFHFMDYSATDKHKTCLFRVDRAGGAVEANAGRWANTNAITSIAIAMGVSQTFVSGSTFALYGIVS